VIKSSTLFSGLEANPYVYFNHSYYCVPSNLDEVLTQTEYSQTYTSAVQKGNLFGVQFHPEKSQKVGIKILQNFVERC
jgi:glutamine amidotransferase